jgi:hypothetical protein
MVVSSSRATTTSASPGVTDDGVQAHRWYFETLVIEIQRDRPFNAVNIAGRGRQSCHHCVFRFNVTGDSGIVTAVPANVTRGVPAT